MLKNYISLKYEEFKTRWSNLFQQKKKIKALEHLNETGNFRHAPYLRTIHDCLEQGFLEAKEEEFLDYLLSKYEKEMEGGYLVWSHRTKWLKGQIRQKTQQTPTRAQDAFQLYLDLDKPRGDIPRVPEHLLHEQQKRYQRRFKS